MAELVGQNETLYTGEIGGDFFPAVKVSDFQERFVFLKNLSEGVIKSALVDADIDVQLQLSDTQANITFADYVVAHPMSESSIKATHKRAVFNIAAAKVLGSFIATDNTKDATARNEQLQERESSLLADARQAISILAKDTYQQVEII